MKIIEVQITPWEQTYFSEAGLFEPKVGDLVIIKLVEGLEVAKVLGFKELSAADFSAVVEKTSLERLANAEDQRIIEENKTQAELAVDFARKAIKRYNLPMKLVDAHFSFDGVKAIFAFIADGRVDFRELVKDLTRHFHKNIRLQQLGVRDEARLCGDFGGCGRDLCCRRSQQELNSVSSDLMELQQIAHRGSDRMTGLCGRLRCCLAYEQATYQELSKKLPALGSTVNTAKGKGQVIRWHVLKGTVDVKVNSETIVEHKV
ncbi:MAG: regulatory iron-sulfur-containing complex subunit RicT [Candidatus Buchananbacteria bacterium]